jgi:hypothetical protein
MRSATDQPLGQRAWMMHASYTREADGRTVHVYAVHSSESAAHADAAAMAVERVPDGLGGYRGYADLQTAVGVIQVPA